MKKYLSLLVVFLVTAAALSACITIPIAAPQKTAEAKETETPLATPAEEAKTEIQPTATLLPKIEYSKLNKPALDKFMQIEVGGTLASALALLGEPKAVYGAGSYNYRAVAGSKVSQPAAVYRFLLDEVPIELIAGTDNGLVLKKQVSTPLVFPRLLDSSKVTPEDGAAYSDMLSQVGENPYLWMEFTLPNPKPDSGTYLVLIWPDKTGQLAAVVKDAVVLKSEYQPNGVVLAASEADGETPRVPRYLDPLPKNLNSSVTSESYFKKFTSLKLNSSEQKVTAAFGEPVSIDTSSATVRVLSYEFLTAKFAHVSFKFTFALAKDNSTMLISKEAALMPLGKAEITARYAPQLLSDMDKDDIEAFMGKGFWSNQYVDFNGDIINSYSWSGEKVFISALFEENDDDVLSNDFVPNDTEAEALSLYEEYVIVIPKGVKKTPRPSRTPSQTTQTPTTTTPPPTATLPPPVYSLPPIRSLPPFSLRPILTPTPKPTPTPVIIR
ncbi:MAG: hypothetical protein BWY62_00343 [Firmicutes bacterium ADurb.Bin356]|nr:MAG: hypothetical protein BWY62_00343 [Firmicutes bacterium ADurb.Bin356]